MTQALPTGTQVGDYVILREVGMGGFGRVYEGEHVTNKSWKVALKEFIHPDQRMFDRFVQESSILLRLQHPNIPRIFALTQYKQKHFIIMEWIEGKTLGHAALAQQMQEEHLVTTAIQICEALEVPHNSNPQVIHRDLKPANVMVRWGVNYHVWVMDFGIAHVAQNQSQALSVVGTPYFASPQQLRGEAAHPNFDIFSLGATMFFVMGPYNLRGKDEAKRYPPFPYERHSGPDQLAQSMQAYPYSAGLKSIVQKAMAYEAAERYQTAAEMKQALQQLIGGGGSVGLVGDQPFPTDFSSHVSSPPGVVTPVTKTGWLPIGKKK